MRTTSPVVLLVEAQNDSRAVFGIAPLASGFQPVLASSGEDASARIGDLLPDVVVTESTLLECLGWSSSCGCAAARTPTRSA